MFNLYQRLAAEFIGTAGLLAAVVGSGIMAERLAAGNAAVALLANSIATGAALFVLILSLEAVSGAHFNPAVTITQLLDKKITVRTSAAYLVIQFLGAAAGVALANTMFGLPVLFASQRVRSGGWQWLGEFVATFGLILTIAATAKVRSPLAVPLAVASYISAAYWFTASTSFANPAVTAARSLSDSFSGIRLADVPAFILVQLAGAAAAMFLARWLFAPGTETNNEREKESSNTLHG